jgi:tetratricopeptide (TPR) repeat protein
LRRPICFTGKASLRARRPFIGKSSQTNPGDAGALHQLGVIQAKMRNVPAAIQLIDQAIEFGSDNAALISDRGVVLQNLNRWDDALADYDRALAIKPGYPEALNNRGVVLHELKRFAEALASFDGALALMSLPFRFNTDLGSIPATVPYLKADLDLVMRWKARIGQEGFKIGIAWQGNPQTKIDEGRSLPLAEFAPLAKLAGVRLISLQKHHGLN